jgi:hypothetical protein
MSIAREEAVEPDAEPVGAEVLQIRYVRGAGKS